MASTFRQQLRAGCKSILDTYQAAHPTELLHTYDYPPGAYNTPLAYIEKAVPETIVHSQQLRFRVLQMQVVVVNKLVSNEQATDEQDVLVDGLVDAFTAAPSEAVANSLLEPVRVVHDTEITDANGTKYAAAIITIQGQIQEGRV